jgi:hypothetical protein
MVAVEREAGRPTTTTPAADAIPLGLRRRGGSAWQVLVISLIGAIVLAVFASRDLSSWLDRMGGGPVLDPIQRLAAGWDDGMARFGLTRPHEALRAGMRRLLDWEWQAPP